MVVLEIFSKMVLKKLKLHNLIKRKIYILTQKKKKARKYIKFFNFYLRVLIFLKSLPDIFCQCYKLHFFQCTQSSNHSSTDFYLDCAAHSLYISFVKTSLTSQANSLMDKCHASMFSLNFQQVHISMKILVVSIA